MGAKKKKDPPVTTNTRTPGQHKVMELLMGPMRASGVTLAVSAASIASTGENPEQVMKALEASGFVYNVGASYYATVDTQGAFCWVSGGPPAQNKPAPQTFQNQPQQVQNQQMPGGPPAQVMQGMPQQAVGQPTQQQFQQAVSAPSVEDDVGDDEGEPVASGVEAVLTTISQQLGKLIVLNTDIANLLRAQQPAGAQASTQSGQTQPPNGWPPAVVGTGPTTQAPNMPQAMMTIGGMAQPGPPGAQTPNPSTWQSQMPPPGAPPVPNAMPMQQQFQNQQPMQQQPQQPQQQFQNQQPMQGQQPVRYGLFQGPNGQTMQLPVDQNGQPIMNGQMR